jgi:hypothetical protein
MSFKGTPDDVTAVCFLCGTPRTFRYPTIITTPSDSSYRCNGIAPSPFSPTPPTVTVMTRSNDNVYAIIGNDGRCGHCRFRYEWMRPRTIKALPTKVTRDTAMNAIHIMASNAILASKHDLLVKLLHEPKPGYPKLDANTIIDGRPLLLLTLQQSPNDNISTTPLQMAITLLKAGANVNPTNSNSSSSKSNNDHRFQDHPRDQYTIYAAIECYRWCNEVQLLEFLDVALPMGLNVTCQPRGFASFFEPLLAHHSNYGAWPSFPITLIKRLIHFGADPSDISLPWCASTFTANMHLPPPPPKIRSKRRNKTQASTPPVLPPDITALNLSYKQQKRVAKAMAKGQQIPKWALDSFANREMAALAASQQSSSSSATVGGTAPVDIDGGEEEKEKEDDEGKATATAIAIATAATSVTTATTTAVAVRDDGSDGIYGEWYIGRQVDIKGTNGIWESGEVIEVATTNHIPHHPHAGITRLVVLVHYLDNAHRWDQWIPAFINNSNPFCRLASPGPPAHYHALPSNPSFVDIYVGKCMLSEIMDGWILGVRRSAYVCEEFVK